MQFEYKDTGRYIRILVLLHSSKLTSNLKRSALKRTVVFFGPLFRFHVCLTGRIFLGFDALLSAICSLLPGEFQEKKKAPAYSSYLIHYLESQVAQNKRPTIPNSHNSLKVAQNYRLLAFQVGHLQQRVKLWTVLQAGGRSLWVTWKDATCDGLLRRGQGLILRSAVQGFGIKLGLQGLVTSVVTNIRIFAI